MSETPALVPEELHAYVDGQLPPDDEQRIEAWLADHPDDAAAVHAYRLQNRRLQESFDAVLNETVPADLNAMVRSRLPSSPAPAPWLRVAASVLLLLVGGVAGWSLHGWQAADGRNVETAFITQAVGAHRVFVREKRHAVEVPSSQEAHLVRWLSNRLGRTLRAPDMTMLGFSLVGGRLLNEGALPAAQFMYENNEKLRLTVYVRAADGTEDTSFRFVSDDAGAGSAAFYWIDKSFAYALVAPLDRDQLMPIANKIYAAQHQED